MKAGDYMTSLPFVRCVGIGTGVYQKTRQMAYDYRAVCVLYGSGTIEIGESKYDTESNEFYIIPPATSYRVCSNVNQEIAVINFDTTYQYSHIYEPVPCVDATEFVKENVMNCAPLKFIEKDMYRISSENTKIFYDMYQTYLRDDLQMETKNFLLSSKLLYIISKIICNKKKNDSVSQLVYKYILDNACEKITVESVAKKFNYSTSYIEKLLRKNYNISFRQLVIETRLKKASWLLENTSLSCSEISSQSGFYSSQHFAQMFRNKYGKKPTDIR